MGALKKIFFLVITLLVLTLCMPLLAQASPLAYPTERLAGPDRIATAITISQQGWDSAQTVILCEYSDYPDSIAATPYAASQNAPILLTAGDSIDPRVVQELQRLKPQKVVLLGGPACLKTSIEQELTQLGFAWVRIGGSDRYQTSVLLAKQIKSDSLILANGDNFPDALSAAPLAGIKQIPIVLTSNQLPDSVIQYYQETKPRHLIVIGGEAVVPSADLTKHNFTVETRLAGQDRYATNAQVVAYMKGAITSNDLLIASGATFPDALAGAALAAKLKAPLLLTEKDDIPPPVYALMREHMRIEPPAAGSDTTGNNVTMQGTITASPGLNLRADPSATAKILTTIPEGTTINLAAQQDGWYQTSYQGQTGWVAADYVTVTTTNQSPTGTTDPQPTGTAPQPTGTGTASGNQFPQQGKITASGGLNLRDTPSSTGKILMTIPQGTTINLAAQQGQWYQTTYQGQTGWVSANYVTIVSATQSNVPSSGAASTTNTANTAAEPPANIDLSVNGTVYILGGPGVISSQAQAIMEGTATSQYQENQMQFPPLPSTLNKPAPPSPGNQESYDPTKEIPVDPFQGIPANTLAGKTIVGDPGHGGADTGAIGPSGTYEKTNTLAIALYLNDILKQAGAKVILNRTTDTSQAAQYSEINDLQARVDIANSNKADLFISIHNNAFSNPDVQGTSTYYSQDNPQNNQSLQLAGYIQSAMVDTVKTNDLGVKEADFYVLHHTTMPSVLVEAAFISNPYEEARLQNPVFRKNVAVAIFHGIYNYFKNPLPKD